VSWLWTSKFFVQKCLFLTTNNEAKIVLFADDTNILVTDENINNLQYKLNNVMTDLQTWFTLNNLIVNTENMLAMSFHTLQNKKSVTPQVNLQVETFHIILKQNFWAYT